MNELFAKQLAIDYCCSADDVQDTLNHFNVYQRLNGRRRFREDGECYLKIAVVNGKLLFSGREDILDWCKNEYATTGGAWFLEPSNIIKINDRASQDDYQVRFAHPFFLPDHEVTVDTKDYEIRWYEQEDVEQFRGDLRFEEAYSFCEDAPDVLGVAAIQDGGILGMAGASADSETMWQIGINVEEPARGKGIAQMLVTLLKDEIIRLGHLPYYGTAFSHLTSQRVALKSGFIPAWAELVTSKIGE